MRSSNFNQQGGDLTQVGGGRGGGIHYTFLGEKLSAPFSAFWCNIGLSGDPGATTAFEICLEILSYRGK